MHNPLASLARNARVLTGVTLSSIALLSFTSCGGGGGGGDDDSPGDPTLTTYAPQTLKNVDLTIEDPNLGPTGTAVFSFTPTSRPSSEQELGTFTYVNENSGDSFADNIVNGTYLYQIFTADRGILFITGGTGSATTVSATRWLGDISGTQMPLDFSDNTGNSSIFVTVNIGPLNDLPATGYVTIDGAALPLNYNGNNDISVMNPNIKPSLNLVTVTFKDKANADRVVTFTRTGGPDAAETGISNEPGLPGTQLLSGTYLYNPDRSGGNSSTLRLYGTSYGVVTLKLAYTTLSSGTTTSTIAQEPFDTAPLPFTTTP